MVKIRLTRIGRTHLPVYRVVAIDSAKKREGQALEQLGQYNPSSSPKVFEVKEDRVKYWLSVGAMPTDTVAYLLSKKGLYTVAPKKFTKTPGRKATERAAKKSAAAE